jgi:hypothetical protein
MAFGGNRDRDPELVELTKTPWPAPPLNLFMMDGTRGVIDLRWDDPSYLMLNSPFQILGVNVYRSLDSEFGPYTRITELPVGATFWRDETDNELIVDEDVSDSFLLRGSSTAGSDEKRYVLQTLHSPIVGEGSRGVPTKSPRDVRVFVDGVEARVRSVHGPTGEVELDVNYYPNVAKQNYYVPVVPTAQSKVTCTYRYTRSFLKTDLRQRIFYRVTTVGLPVGCNLANVQCTDLVETPLEYAASTNTFEIEKLDWIWKEAVRRNRWILEQGGERVKVFLQKNSGVPCSCYSDTHKQPTRDCHKCFPPDTLVRTEAGYRPIQSIKVGDRVLSSDGSYRAVVEVMVSHFSGSLSSIKPSVSTRPILSTPSHPFYTLVGHHGAKCSPKRCSRRVKNGDIVGGANRQGPGVRLLPSGRWWARVGSGKRGKRLSLGTFGTRDEAEQAVKTHIQEHCKAHSLEWVDASSLGKGDWLATQHPLLSVDLHRIEVPLEFQKVSSYGPSRNGSIQFEVSAEFLWVIGLYLAEGCASTRSITFGLHANETVYQDRVKTFFEAHGYSVSIRSGVGLGVSVVVNGSNLSEWFPNWLGAYSHNKAIPEELMCLPPEKQRHLLQGIYDGDGWKSGTEVTQTSEVLALQMVEILHRMGKQPLVRLQKGPPTPKGNPRKIAYCVNWEGGDFTKGNRKGRWAFEDHNLSEVRGVSTEPYDGLVYNLEVGGNHTYIVQGVVVHNCYGTGHIGGYEGPYDIIVAPDDAEVSIAQTEHGRTVKHQYEVWTGPQPLLSQRDFIMKVNGDRYSIGPVRMPSNRGNILQQHFSISAFDEKDIRYSVPVGDPVKYAATQFAPRGPEFGGSTEITDHEGIGDEREYKGRTTTWKNTTY